MLGCGIDPDRNMYVLDFWRKQASSDEWVEAFCDLVTDWKPRQWAEEEGQINAGVGPFLERRQCERNAFTYRQQFPSRADTAVRAQSIRGRVALRGLHLPQNAPWLPQLRSELLAFPNGKYDDQVDMLGLIGQLLDTIAMGEKPKPPEKEKPVSDYRPWQPESRDNDWIAY